MSDSSMPAAPPRASFWGPLFNVFFASFGFVAVRFLLGPVRIKILTGLLTKEQYGTLTLISLTISFITLVSSLGSLEFLLRKIPGRPLEYQNGLFKTILLFFGGLSLALALAGMALLHFWPAARSYLSSADILACGLLLVLTVHLNQYFYFLMGLSKYALSRIAQLLQGDAWFLPLIVFFWWGTLRISSVLWIWVGWLILTALIMQPWIRFSRVRAARASRAELSEVLRFGLPLVPLIVGEWMFMVQDRYILAYTVGVEAVANYALCMNIAMVGVLVGSAALDILLVEFFKLRNRFEGQSLDELSTHVELRRYLTDMLRYTLLAAIPFGAALLVLGEPVIRLLSNPRFLDALPTLRWLALLPACYFAFVIFGRVQMSAAQNARVGASTLAAAGINILLNLIFVPRLGERGAALSAVASYGVLAVYLGLRLRLWRWLVAADLKPLRLALLAGLCFIGYREILAQLASFGGIVVLLAAALWTVALVFALGLLRREDLRLVLGTFARETPPAPN